MLVRVRSRKNRKALFVFAPAVLLMVVAVALVIPGCGSSSSTTTTAAGATTTVAIGNAGAVPLLAMPFTVSIANGKLSDAQVEIPVGSSVDFKNAEDDSTAQHQFVADGGSFDSMVLDPGAEFVVVFDTGGTFAFHDALNPDIKGSIVVTASATAPDVGIVPVRGPLVRIQAGKLSVDNVQVRIGEGLTFANTEDDNAVNHHLVADDGSFTTGVLRPNMSFSVTFQKAGTYTYHDQLDPNIKGTITVQAP